MPVPARPLNLELPFAINGAKATIPVDPAIAPRASYDEGFPPETMIPVAAGGQPPYGTDFNGIFFDITSHILWINTGGQYQFDSVLSAAIGGYPKGMVLQDDAGIASYVSLVDGNTTDFNATPASIGTLWAAYSGAAFSNTNIATTGGAIVLTEPQYTANMITLTGVLVGDVTLTFPAAAKGQWLIVNNTTGAFNVNAITSGGAGVPILQGAADTVSGDGVDIAYVQASAITQATNNNSKALANTEYVDRAVAFVGGFYQDTGLVANAYIVATIPPTLAYVDGQSLRFRTSRANSGAVTLDAGPGPFAITQEDGGPLQAGDIPVGSITTVTYSAVSSKWVFNGATASDYLDSPVFRGVPTTPTPPNGSDDLTIPNTAWVNSTLAGKSADAALYMLGLAF